MLQTFRRAQELWVLWIGAQPASRVIWTLALAFSVWVVLDVMVLRLTSGLNHATYDAMVRHRVHVAAPDPRIIVIDIDEHSLREMSGEFGRWPWPRDTLATVLRYLEKQGPAVIVWDILFTDVDRFSPGGDAAFDAEAGRSAHSVFSVTRLDEDGLTPSQISRLALPGLWAGAASSPAPDAPSGSTVALIPPALPAVAAGRLGYNNGHVESDGVLRRFRPLETLRDGSTIQSTALSALALVDPAAYGRAIAAGHPRQGELIAWRREVTAYPHLPFVQVFAAADGGQPAAHLPDFAGKIVIIGSTAPSLHDIHPTPVSSSHPGVDALATVIDNAIHERRLAELPRWLDALIAIALCLALAFWARVRSDASLLWLNLAVPLALLFVSYLTLNGSPVFIDLQLSAGLALVFFAVVRYVNRLRRERWCRLPAPDAAGLVLWPLRRLNPWLEAPLDRLIDALEQHAPHCRVVVPDIHEAAFQRPRWPELGLYAAVVGPAAELGAARATLLQKTPGTWAGNDDMLPLGSQPSRAEVARVAMGAWQRANCGQAGSDPPTGVQA